MQSSRRKQRLLVLTLDFAMCNAGTGLFGGKTENAMCWTTPSSNARSLRYRSIRGRTTRRDGVMVRKGQTQTKTTPRVQQTDAAFARLLITAMRIYGDPAVRTGKLFGSRLIQK